MEKNNRQAINLTKWSAKKPKVTDPHFSTRAILKPEIANYIAEVVTAGDEPQLFLTLWVNKSSNSAALGMAIPREYVGPQHRPSLEDFFE